MPLTFSPQTQHYMHDPNAAHPEGAHGGQPEDFFEEAFTQMAFTQMEAKHPDLLEFVTTFKPIKIDVNTGVAVGVFILVMEDQEIYIPAVSSNNQLKPLEMFYHKNSNQFRPLDHDHLAVALTAQQEVMGEPAPLSRHVESDADISHFVEPPNTGKAVYASDNSLVLLDFLRTLPNRELKKVANTFRANKKLRKIAAEIYGPENLVAALAPKKRPVKKIASKKPKVNIVTKDSSEADILEVAEGFTNIMAKLAEDGYAVKDTREDHNFAVSCETPRHFTQITQPGVYKFITVEGARLFGVAARPALPLREKSLGVYKGDVGIPSDDNQTHYVSDHSPVTLNANCTSTVIILENGHIVSSNLTDSSRQYAEIPGSEDLSAIAGKLTKILSKAKTPAPRDSGAFLRIASGTPEITEPINVDRVKTKQGVTYIYTESGQTIILDPGYTGNKIHMPHGEKVTYLPKGFVFIRKKDTSVKLIQDPRTFKENFKGRLKEAGAHSTSVDHSSDGMFVVSGESKRLVDATRLEALSFLLTEENLDGQDASELIKHAQKWGHATTLNVPSNVFADFLKTAQQYEEGYAGEMAHPEETHPEEMHPEEMHPEEMHPEEMGIDPGELLSQAVQDVSQEVLSLYQQQEEALAIQRANLEKQMQTLGLVAARAQEIAQGVPSQESPVLAEVGQSVLPPSMAIADPEGAHMHLRGEGDHPEEMGMEGHPEDPYAQDMGGYQEQMHPEEQQMMEEAGELQDPEMFDASAVGSIAGGGGLEHLATNYVPALEKSLDHAGRMLLSAWINAAELKEQTGEMGYEALEEKLRNVFKSLGGLVINVNHSISPSPIL